MNMRYPVRDLLREEWRELVTVNPSDRPWQMPFAAALASGLPLAVGALFDRLDYGLISALGALVFLYLPWTSLHHRMIWLMACAFGMTACFTFGVMGHFLPLIIIAIVAVIAVLATVVCRFYRVGPPGSLFFVMAAAIGAYAPGKILDAPTKVGLFTMGSLLSCLVAFIYSLAILRIRAPEPVAPPPPFDFDFVMTDSVVIGAFVGISLTVAHGLDLQRPYWVPISCLAVIQGVSLRAIWTRHLHRVLGTGLGMVLSWGLLSLPFDKWSVCAMVTALAFVVQSAVVRHYGFATIFITPLALFMAEAASLGRVASGPLIQARFIDTLVGCVIGLAGGFFLHGPRLRRGVGRQLRRLTPPRLRARAGVGLD